MSRANEWVRTFIYSFIIETRTFFVTSDVALISALETMLLKSAFMHEMFFNSKAISSTGIFLVMFFSNRIVK